MDNLGLGKIIPEGKVVQKDAIHIAVFPATAMTTLRPGDRVNLVPGLTTHVVANALSSIGIVDPFLETVVRSGERCWIYLFPGSVTSLRHDWEHPAFERRSEAKATERLESRRSEALKPEDIEKLKGQFESGTADKLEQLRAKLVQNGVEVIG